MLFVEDEEHIVNGFRRLLGREFDFTHAWSVGSAFEILARHAATGHRFAGHIIDLGLPEPNQGYEVVDEVRRRDPLARVLIFSNAWAADVAVEAAIREVAYVPKLAPIQELRGVLDAWRRPEVQLADVCAAWTKTYGLTASEANLLAAACGTLDRRMLANTLGCEVSTVNAHASRLAEKTGRDSLQQVTIDVLREVIAKK